MLYIRDGDMDDLHEIMRIYKYAQDFMIKTGNPKQWGHFNPKESTIIKDIENGICKVIYDEFGIHGVFALLTGIEKTYAYIEDGEWLNDEEYITIHRLASDGKVHGIFDCAFSYCRSVSSNIRIDTHEDNHIMQHLLLKNEFKKCGIIYVENGTKRIAYQWLL